MCSQKNRKKPRINKIYSSLLNSVGHSHTKKRTRKYTASEIKVNEIRWSSHISTQLEDNTFLIWNVLTSTLGFVTNVVIEHIYVILD